LKPPTAVGPRHSSGGGGGIKEAQPLEADTFLNVKVFFKIKIMNK
jgi:hypothetical protein